MSYLTQPAEWYFRVAKGQIPKHSIVTKFGSGTLTTSLAPITTSGVYQTPTTATALEFVSSDANDTAAGTGAREVTIIGLNSSFAEVTQTVTTNGTAAVALGTNLVRLYRMYVSSSGTYATSSAGSHVGNLTIRVSGGGATWATISASPFPLGQTLIAAYTVPLGYTGYLLSKNISVDSAKSTDIYMFQRTNINDVTSPYSGAMRIIEREIGLSYSHEEIFTVPKGPFVGPCDIGFMGLVTVGTATASVEFELLLVQD